MEDWYIDGINRNSVVVREGPFKTFEEAELWAATHDMTQYVIDTDNEDNFEDEEDWDWYWEEDEDDLDWMDDDLDWAYPA